ncbi:MAG TPA: protein kinase, partial [Polyangia bacterium]
MSSSDGQSDDTLVPGTILGRYEIGRLLGRGGMGAVYQAVHRDLKKRVAIKVLSAKLASEEAKQRFLREGEAASRIQHANVVDVTDVGVEGGLSYLVMEFLEGEDLSSRLAREGSLTPRQAADILLPVCAGLS